MDDLWFRLAAIQSDIQDLELQRNNIEQAIYRKRAYMDELLIEIRCSAENVSINKSQLSPLLFV